MELRQIFKKKQKQEVKKKKEVRIVLRSDRQAIILKLMKKCIGRQNAITHEKLFEEIYGSMENYSELQIYFLWHNIRMDLNWIRKTTKCFIGCDYNNRANEWYYYVVKSSDDAKPYCKIMDNTVKKCQFMKARCLKSVEEEWYNEF